MITRPLVSSARAVNFTLPRLLAQEPALIPGTTAEGHSAMRVAVVCTSPLGSLKLTSASSSLAWGGWGRPFKVMVAAPSRSVVTASLSATSWPSRWRAAGSSSVSSPPAWAAGSVGGSKLYSGWLSKLR